MRCKGLLLGTAMAVWVATVAPASGSTAPLSVSWQADGCREAALFMPTDYDNVLALVPEPFRDDILRAGLTGREQATLIFTLNRCGDTAVVSRRGTFATDTATEVILGVMLTGSQSSDEAFQFYTLINYIDWEPLATAFNAIGLPTVHAPHLHFDATVDPLLKTGALVVDVAAPGEHIVVEGSIVSAGPPPVETRAANLALGSRGVVRVDHHSPLMGINPGATARITTDRADSVLARAMGATTAQVDGLFFEKGPGHDHTATLVN